MDEANKGGRPAHHEGEVKKAAIAVRTAPSIRDALRLAADESGRSVTQEVEARLVASFEKDGGRRSPETQQLLNRIGGEIAEIEALTGKSWHRDRKTAGAVLEMFARRPIAWVNVDNPFEDEVVNTAWQKLSSLREERDEAADALKGLGIDASMTLNALAAFSASPPRGLFGGKPMHPDIRNALAIAKTRWRERHQLESFDGPDAIKNAAKNLIDHLERLDEQVAEAEAKFNAEMQPYAEAESEGRAKYRSFRQRKARDAMARGEIPEIADYMLLKE